MMWKTLIFLAVASAVLAGKIKRHQSNYEFHIKHDYDYHKHHEESEDHEHKTEELPEEKHEPEDVEVKKEEEEHIEEKKDEPELQNEDDTASTHSEEPEQDEKYEHKGYEFSYEVKDPYKHDIKGQHEKKIGDEVMGVYWLIQPDGLKRTVDYHADKHSGFHAKVEYSKSEEPEDDEHSKPTSEYYLTHYHGYKKYIPVKEEPEEEQDKQEESAQHIPIYVI